MKITFVLCVAILVPACKSRPDAASDALVYQGKASTVVYSGLLSAPDKGYCSGVVLCPYAVATARHCLSGEGGAFKDPKTIRFTTAANPEFEDGVLKAPYYSFSDWEQSDFVAFAAGYKRPYLDRFVVMKVKDEGGIKLDKYAPLPTDAQIDALLWTDGDKTAGKDPADWGGKWLVLGFGRDGAGKSGYKQEGFVGMAGWDTTADSSPNQILTVVPGTDKQITCLGDSGGGLIRRDDDGNDLLFGLLHGGNSGDCSASAAEGSAVKSYFLAVTDFDADSKPAGTMLKWLRERRDAYCPATH